MFTSANVVPPKKTTSHSVETQKLELKVYNRKPKNVKNVGSSKKAKIVESKNANHSEPNHTWGSNATDITSSSSLVMTVRFGNDHIARIMSVNFYDVDLEDLHFGKNTLLLFVYLEACALGKSKKSSHEPKAEDTNQEKLYLLHMDLYGPMRVESINGKRYILVIVDDYSRFTWVIFLRTKDEASEAMISTDKSKITRKQSKASKHGHENQKSTKPKPQKTKALANFHLQGPILQFPKVIYNLKERKERQGPNVQSSQRSTVLTVKVGAGNPFTIHRLPHFHCHGKTRGK
ncbi:ribonuclease H-like domain-containing protein [Tanacetum coccineum]